MVVSCDSFPAIHPPQPAHFLSHSAPPAAGNDAGSVCDLCQGTTPAQQLYSLDSCSHHMCDSCLAFHIRQPSSTCHTALICPAYNCYHPLSHRDLVDILSPAQYRAYAAGRLHSLLSSLPPPAAAPLAGLCLNNLSATRLKLLLQQRGLCSRGDRATVLLATSTLQRIEEGATAATTLLSLPLFRAAVGAAVTHPEQLSLYAVHCCLLWLNPEGAGGAVEEEEVETGWRSNTTAGGGRRWSQGVGFESDSDLGGHRAGGRLDKKRRTEVEKAQAKEQRGDWKLRWLLRTLLMLLQSHQNVCCEVVELLRDSALWSTLRSLLVNDSLMDICQRADLYLTTLQLLSWLAGRPAFLQLLATHPQLRLPQLLPALASQASLFVAHSQAVTPPYGVTQDVALAVGVAVEIASVCHRVLTAIVAFEGNLTDNSISNCSSCSSSVGGSHSSSPLQHCNAGNNCSSGGSSTTTCTTTNTATTTTTTNTTTNTDMGGNAHGTPVKRGRSEGPLDCLEEGSDLPTDEAHQQYSGSLAKWRLQLVSLLQAVTEGRVPYSFAKQLKSTPPLHQGRAIRIMQELSSLSTTLPVAWQGSIFLAADEARVDVMKALLVGPEGTPYANGVFEFDLLLPQDYPTSPPQVQLVTTGGGRIRFNPNLYQCGTVCLSLLGTWNGPGWDVRHSTLLQLLVSIHSMVLVHEPYFNEPGFERCRGTPMGELACIHHQLAVQEATVQVAMLQQLRQPPAVFVDAVQTHFTLKASSILKQCEGWLEERETLPSQQQLQHTGVPMNGFASGFGVGLNSSRASMLLVVEELRGELRKLQIRNGAQNKKQKRATGRGNLMDLAAAEM